MNSLGRMVLRVLLLCLFCGFSDAAVPQLPFKDFLKQFQVKSPTVLQAQRSYARVEQTRDSRNDLWQSRFVVRPEMNFSARKFDSGIIEDISNRSQNVSGTYTQNFPTGTSLELSGQKFLEVANPLFSSTDRQYSATISQDLFRNAFGEVQKSQAKKAQKDLEVAELEFRQSIVGACEEAFNLYVDTFIQQEVSQLLDSQLRDAKQALRISMRLYKDRLITKIDKLSSESDYINTKNEAERAKQRLVNGKRQILAYLDRGSLEMALVDPSGKLETPVTKKQAETLSEIIADTRVVSQELDVKRSRSDRRTDVQLNLQAGERFGRSRFDLSLVEFKEEFLLASVNIGFDIINRTEDSD